MYINFFTYALEIKNVKSLNYAFLREFISQRQVFHVSTPFGKRSDTYRHTE